MKKTLLSLMLMLMAGISAWADSTLYERALGSWASTDITKTAGTVGAWYSTTFTTDATNGLYQAAATGSRSAVLTYAPTENSIQTIDCVFSNLGNTGKATNYSYLRIGSAIEIQSNQQNQVGYVVINGTSNDISNCNKKNYNRGGDLWTIHAVINTATNTLMEFTLLGNSTSAKNASFTLAEPTSLGAATYNTITIGTVRAGGSPAVALNSIKISEKKQEVTTANYTVRYICGTEEVKDAVTRSGAIGVETGVSTDDKADLYNADKTKKYIYVSDDAGKEIAADGSTVVTVTFREASSNTVSVKDNFGKSLGSALIFEGESTYFYLPQYRYVDGKLYESPSASEGTIDSYGVIKFSDLTADKEVTITYTADPVQNVVFFSEAEDLEGFSTQRDVYTQGRMSNGAAGYGAAGSVVTTLKSGKYTITSSTRSGTTNFYAGDATVHTITSGGSVSTTTSEEFPLRQPSTDITVSAGSYKVYFDYVIIRQTAPGCPEDPNDIFWTDALPTLKYNLDKANARLEEAENVNMSVIGVNLFQYNPGNIDTFAAAIAQAQNDYDNLVSSEDVYASIETLKEAIAAFNVNLPNVNETYTFAVIKHQVNQTVEPAANEEEVTLYLNIDGDKPVLSATPSYLQFHECEDPMASIINKALVPDYYLYNTPTRRYLGLEDGRGFRNTNLVTDKLSPIYFSAYHVNEWNMGIQGISTVAYNNEVFIFGSEDFWAAVETDVLAYLETEDGQKEMEEKGVSPTDEDLAEYDAFVSYKIQEFSQTNTCYITWFIAREDAPETPATDTEEGDATATSINGVSSAVAPAAIYSANGARLQTLQKGMNIVKMADGSVKKVMVK